MKGYYTYLLAALPFLSFGGPAPFSYEELIRRSEGLIPAGDLEMLRRIPRIAEESPQSSSGAVAGWLHFEMTLRNEMVRLRADRLHWDAAAHYRNGGKTTLEMTHLVQEARRSASPLEGEKVLDAARWRALEELAAGHYFDRDALLIYALKLRILLRWERIRKSDAAANLKDVLGAITRSRNEE